MQACHMPNVNARYWSAITLASLFGTNLGDLYGHEIGLTIYQGLAVLAALAAATFLIERRDHQKRELYYWLVIIIIRTGATNIADYLAYKVHVPEAPLSLGLATIIALFGWMSLHRRNTRTREAETTDMPETGNSYWMAMLGAGVFGTVVGDIAQHVIGQTQAAIVLTTVLVGALLLWRARIDQRLWLYWIVVAIARTTGTALGDWLAESPAAHLNLPIATAVTGTAFVLVLVIAGRDQSLSGSRDRAGLAT